MDGIERIAARIREDAEQEIARMNQEATEQVEAIQAQAQAQASREREEILARGRRAADERLERLKSAALMQRRTLELGARQEVLAEAFEKALDQLCSLPDEKMVSLLASLALQAAPGGRPLHCWPGTPPGPKPESPARCRGRQSHQCGTSAHPPFLTHSIPAAAPRSWPRPARRGGRKEWCARP